jgi:hypothetical protein
MIPTWRMLKVVRWEDDSPPWQHYPRSSTTTDDVIAHDAICQFSYELFVLPHSPGHMNYLITSVGRLMSLPVLPSLSRSYKLFGCN